MNTDPRCLPLWPVWDALVLAVAFAYPVLVHLELWGKADWDQHMFFLGPSG